jgi:anhydro-N-acetylmuramic acid kinase
MAVVTAPDLPGSAEAPYIGLMSGTSLDGVDAVLVRFGSGAAGQRLRQQVLGHVHRPFKPALRDELLALNAPGLDELHRAAIATHGLAEAYAAVVDALLATTGLSVAEVRAAGAHGQTVRHRPGGIAGSPGYTIQLDPGAGLAERTGLEVVSDFRVQDVEAGGQGAPLVPPYHRALFAEPGRPVVVANIGGMANLSVIDRCGHVAGHDSGPGNVLLDAWCRQHTGCDFDEGGRMAASGRVDDVLLERLLAEPYFAEPPPKSTGRDLFSREWLLGRAGDRLAALSAVDVQATLAELTAATLADAIAGALRATGTVRNTPVPRAATPVAVWLCGGGALNADLRRRLSRRLPGASVRATDEAGVPATQVEACAFAWLARERLAGRATTDPAVTGARGARVTGAVRTGLRPVMHPD